MAVKVYICALCIAYIQDEIGVCKNLLQEIAQRAGVSLPVYTTIRTGPKHIPLFKCIVEIGGRSFKGETATTKKQAEKNAASAAWTALKQFHSMSSISSWFRDSGEANDNVEARKASHPCQMDDQNSFNQFSPSQTQLTVRERMPLCREHSVAVGQNFYPSSVSSRGSEVLKFDSSPRTNLRSQLPVNPPTVPSLQSGHFPFVNQHLSSCNHLSQDAGIDLSMPTNFKNNGHPSQAMLCGSSSHQGRRHLRRHSLSGMGSPILCEEAMISSRASGGGNMMERAMLRHHHPQIRGLPYQSLSERFEITRPSLPEDLHQRDENECWYGSVAHPPKDLSYFSVYPGKESIWCKPLQSQSDRFEMTAHQWNQIKELHQNDDDDWLSHGSGSSNSPWDKEKGCDEARGLVQGWMNKGERSLVKEHRIPNFREGWPRGDTLKHSLQEEGRHGYKSGWLCDRVSNPKPVDEITPRSRYERHSHCKHEVWSCTEISGRSSENDRSFGEGLVYNKELSYNDKPTYTAASPLPVTSPLASQLPVMSSVASPFSSLWSKSSQWLGSPMSACTSSAAAAVASSLGFCSPRSSAPAVRLRQMVPVCSAPPPRRAENAFSRGVPHNDDSALKRGAGVMEL